MVTDAEIRAAQPKEKPYKLTDAHGLHLYISPTGGKSFRLKFRVAGVEKLLTLGKYPHLKLAEARQLAQDAKRLHSQGVDPAQAKQAKKHAAIAAKQAEQAKAHNTFKAIAHEWYETKTTWKDSHGVRVFRRLEMYVFPTLGSLQIDEISAPLLLETLRKIEDAGSYETAHRTLQVISQVFTYAKQTGRQHQHPADDLKGALKAAKITHFAAITNPAEVGAALRTIHNYWGTLPVQVALKLGPLVFVRPGDLRKMRWADVDLAHDEWRLITEKGGQPLIVPLASQAVELIKTLQPLTGTGVYVFPSVRSQTRPMSNNTVLEAYRRMGIPKEKLSGHGWRATARTLLDEVHHCSLAVIELQTTHTVRDPLGTAYNRTSFLPERKAMMQVWADYLDALRVNPAMK